MTTELIIENNILTKYNGCDEVIEIPEGVTAINQNVFLNNWTIKEVKLPESLKKIDSYAFCNCKNLEKINLENIKYIEVSAFENCKNLENINLSSVMSISSLAFKDTGITNLKIKNIEYIEENAFYHCKNLTSVDFIYDKKHTIDSIFGLTNDLKRIKINKNCILSKNFLIDLLCLETIESYDSFYKVKNGILYNEDMTELIYCPPNNDIKNYTIPDSVITLKEMCFLYNEKIEKLIFGKNIKNIESSIFYMATISEIVCNKLIDEIKVNTFKNANINILNLKKTNITKLNAVESGILQKNSRYLPALPNVQTVILPNKLQEIKHDNSYCASFLYQIAQPKENFNKEIQMFINKNKIDSCCKTLDELIEEGKTFREASQIISSQER